MKINDARELHSIVTSIRKKAFEEVANLIKSNAVNKDTDGFVMMYEDDLIGLINTIDSAKFKKQRESLTDEGEVSLDVTFSQTE